MSPCIFIPQWFPVMDHTMWGSIPLSPLFSNMPHSYRHAYSSSTSSTAPITTVSDYRPQYGVTEQQSLKFQLDWARRPEIWSTLLQTGPCHWCPAGCAFIDAFHDASLEVCLPASALDIGKFAIYCLSIGVWIKPSPNIRVWVP